MWGCCSAAARRTSRWKRSAAEHRGQLGRKHLEHHPPAQRDFLGEEDPAHAPAAQLALDAVLGAECGGEALLEIVHQGFFGSPASAAIRFFTSCTLGCRSASASFQSAVNLP